MSEGGRFYTFGCPACGGTVIDYRDSITLVRQVDRWGPDGTPAMTTTITEEEDTTNSDTPYQCQHCKAYFDRPAPILVGWSEEDRLAAECEGWAIYCLNAPNTDNEWFEIGPAPSGSRFADSCQALEWVAYRAAAGVPLAEKAIEVLKTQAPTEHARLMYLIEKTRQSDWTPQDSDEARGWGWDIWRRSEPNEDGEWFEVQRADEASIFETDHDARWFVAQTAASPGSLTHRLAKKALDFLEKRAPKEYERLVAIQEKTRQAEADEAQEDKLRPNIDPETLERAKRLSRALSWLGPVKAELERIIAETAPFVDRHHACGVLFEEVDELWDEIKADSPDHKIIHETVQVVAVGLKLLGDLIGVAAREEEGDE